MTTALAAIHFSQSVFLGDGSPGMVRFAALADSARLADIERAVWSADHAASVETIRARIEANPASTFLLCSLEGYCWGFYSLVPVEPKDVTDLKPWEYYAELAVSHDHFRRDRKVTHLHSISLTVSDGAPRRAATTLVRTAAEYSGCIGLLGSTIVTRAPRYHKHANEMTFTEYYGALVSGRLMEPSFKLGINAGGVPDGFRPDYFDDPESRNFGLVFRFPVTGSV
jgi:hypothetical protein